MHDLIYDRPGDYDLEHEHDDTDVRFHVELARRLAPRRVVELGAGSGRVTLPLAELALREGFELFALDAADSMLDAARRKLDETAPAARDRVRFVLADWRTWEAPAPIDLILVPCASVSHLLSLEDQLATWRRAYANLAPGGRFVVDAVMPDVAVFGDSLGHRPRAIVEIDGDTEDADGRRLLRYKTTTYAPHEQRADIRFLYDKFARGEHSERWLSDFASHVYFPRELQLLFLHAGYGIEATYGDYRFGRLRAASREMIVVGRRPEG